MASFRSERRSGFEVIWAMDSAAWTSYLGFDILVLPISGRRVNLPDAAGRSGPMYTRLVYAVNKTVEKLHVVFRTKIGYEIALAFMLTVAGFGAMQFVINHDVNNVFAQIIVGCAIGTVLFLSTIGFITFISIIFVFAYDFTIGPERGFNSPKLSGWSRGWRIVLSFAVSGAVTAAVFNLFYEGLKEIPF